MSFSSQERESSSPPSYLWTFRSGKRAKRARPDVVKYEWSTNAQRQDPDARSAATCGRVPQPKERTRRAARAGAEARMNETIAIGSIESSDGRTVATPARCRPKETPAA